MPNPAFERDSPEEGERVAKAFVSAIAAMLTLVAYFIIIIAFASKTPSGPPKLLFDIFASNLNIGLAVAASLAGFVLGSSKMANIFADLWGTSERSNTTGFQLVIVLLIIVVSVAVITHTLLTEVDCRAHRFI